MKQTYRLIMTHTPDTITAEVEEHDGVWHCRECFSGEVCEHIVAAMASRWSVITVRGK